MQGVFPDAGFSYEIRVTFLRHVQAPQSMMSQLIADQFRGLLKRNTLVSTWLNWKITPNWLNARTDQPLKFWSPYLSANQSIVLNTPLAYSYR
jgi:hypothetical protein